MSTSRHDAGMLAVARVRGVREQDSRIGLQQALAEQHGREQRVADLRKRMESGSRFDSGPAGDFLVLRASLDALGSDVRAAEQDVATSVTISEAAYETWRVDRARLAAVELLLERRAAERRAEAAHREARELDEIAVQGWQRRETERGSRMSERSERAIKHSRPADAHLASDAERGRR